MNLEEIMEQSPECPGYGGGQWAMYSVFCCWWTSFPDDLGNTQEQFGYPNGMIIKHPDGTQTELKESPGLPCCPHCGSVLMQAPLDKFVAAAADNPSHYGEKGIAAFILAHSKNAIACHKQWSLY